MTKCDDCKADISGTFYYEVDGKTICSKDYEEVILLSKSIFRFGAIHSAKMPLPRTKLSSADI